MECHMSYNITEYITVKIEEGGLDLFYFYFYFYLFSIFYF